MRSYPHVWEADADGDGGLELASFRNRMPSVCCGSVCVCTPACQRTRTRTRTGTRKGTHTHKYISRKDRVMAFADGDRVERRIQRAVHEAVWYQVNLIRERIYFVSNAINLHICLYTHLAHTHELASIWQMHVKSPIKCVRVRLHAVHAHRLPLCAPAWPRGHVVSDDYGAHTFLRTIEMLNWIIRWCVENSDISCSILKLHSIYLANIDSQYIYFV